LSPHADRGRRLRDRHHRPGFPGKSVCHGGLGWSSIVLLRGHGRVALIDAGSFGMRNAAITAWYGNDMERTTLFRLTSN
jgi:hypothetical protein